MSFLSRMRRKKSKDELFQGKKSEDQNTKVEKRINEPVRCETCGTDFSSPQDFERHAMEDHPRYLSKLQRG
jgi:formylmethanofuran dehydrogenase subunit E